MRAQRKLRRVNEDDPITRQMGDDRQVSQAETGSLASATFSSLDEMQRWVFRRILNEGAPASPRDLPTLELPPIQLVLTNPRRRVLTSVSRKWRLPLAVGEFCWHLSASNELSFIRYYSERWSEFADDEQTIRGSCYGYRLFRGAEGSPSQWETAHKLLRQDPSTRRAVLLMSQPLLDRDITAKDVACATSLQFLLRDGQLDAVLHMRSNDAFWGLPYDVFLFTMLQDCSLLNSMWNQGATIIQSVLCIYIRGTFALRKRFLTTVIGVILKCRDCRTLKRSRNFFLPSAL